MSTKMTHTCPKQLLLVATLLVSLYGMYSLSTLQRFIFIFIFIPFHIELSLKLIIIVIGFPFPGFIHPMKAYSLTQTAMTLPVS